MMDIDKIVEFAVTVNFGEWECGAKDFWSCIHPMDILTKRQHYNMEDDSYTFHFFVFGFTKLDIDELKEYFIRSLKFEYMKIKIIEFVNTSDNDYEIWGDL